MNDRTRIIERPQYRRYIALGDSFTEGLNDEIGLDGRYRGWADRVAATLNNHHPGLLYANLAIRGRLMGQVLEEQVPAAVAQNPDLVTLAAGVNDALRREYDLATVSEQLRQSVSALSDSGATVIVFAFGDPSRRSDLMGRVAGRLKEYNAATKEIAADHGARVVDFWGAAVFDDDALWSSDRLHLSSFGHELAARAALEAMGYTDDSWRSPASSTPPHHPLIRAGGHAAWAAGHLTPWLLRRARGVSSGDGIEAKRPLLAPVD
jgi:lysophospholipase L1-like esterase